MVKRQMRKSWFERDKMIYYSVTSKGVSCFEWIKVLRKKFRISPDAENVLQSFDIPRPVRGVMTHMVIIPGKLFTRPLRNNQKILARALRLGFTQPHPEVACLTRMLLSDKDLEKMGLQAIVIMHEPLWDVGTPLHGSLPHLFTISRGTTPYEREQGIGGFFTSGGQAITSYPKDYGFAFVVPEKGVKRSKR